MRNLSLTPRAASSGLSRIASRAILVAAAALGLTACAYSDPHQRSYHSYGYGYGSGARVAVGHYPDVVYRTHGSRARAATRPRHVIVPGSYHVVPGHRHVAPRPGYNRKPPHIAPRAPIRPGVRPPHAQGRPGLKPPQRHVRPAARSGRDHARPPRAGHQARPGHIQRPGAGSAGTRRPDARRTVTAGPNERARPPVRTGHQRGGRRR